MHVSKPHQIELGSSTLSVSEFYVIVMLSSLAYDAAMSPPAPIIPPSFAWSIRSEPGVSAPSANALLSSPYLHMTLAARLFPIVLPLHSTSTSTSNTINSNPNPTTKSYHRLNTRSNMYLSTILTTIFLTATVLATGGPC